LDNKITHTHKTDKKTESRIPYLTLLHYNML
jgi:hypothetical protein